MPPARSRSLVVDPDSLAPPERRQLADELYAVHSQIFEGVDRAQFVSYVVESKARVNRIHLTRDGEGRLVGYAALHFFDRQVQGRDAIVVRCEVGVLRSARGRLAAGPFLARTIVAQRLMRPRTPMWLFACPVHPASYVTVLKRARTCWPHPDLPTPPDLEAAMFALADEFGLEPPDPARPLVRHVGWTTTATEEEHRYWQQSQRPGVRFYVEQNPGYAGGDGLLILVPVEGAAIVAGLADLVRDRSARVARTVRSRWERRTGGRPLGVAECAAVLARTALLGDLPDEARALAHGARHLIVPAGEWVFRQGDPGDALYVLESGAAYVVDETTVVDDQPRILDQLGPGDVFGEIALLTGAPRSAGVRAATDLRLARIDAARVRDAVARPGVSHRVWAEAGRRRLDTLMRDEPRFADLRRDHRAAWFDAGVDLAHGGFTVGAERPWLFLMEGRAHLDGPTAAVLTAPSLVLLQAGATVRLSGDARARSLPAPQGSRI